MNIYEELKWRGLVSDCTDEKALGKLLESKSVTLYCGFDPTADSLHVGSLVPLLALRRFQNAGHRPIAVAGGATGMIGDPSGKTAERQLLTREILQANIEAVKGQLARLLDFEATDNSALLVDNADWTADVSFLEFLRDIGKLFTVNMMVAKESVRARMQDRDVGISYTEFSYMLLQAFDFYRLREERECELQIGGSDQWGNITAGIDLCRKKLGQTVFGLTLPLITNADGSKFGKSVEGAIWLDPARTSPYKFYQFWINIDDRDVVRYLKYFTFLDQATIQGLTEQHEANPGAREAHRALAKEMTDMIHGSEATEDAVKASRILFGGDMDGVTEKTFRDVVGEIPTVTMERAAFEAMGLIDLLAAAGVCKSKGEARRDIQGNGISVNNVKEPDIERVVSTGDLLFDKHLLLRKGKKNYVVVSVE
mgnify:CR=1 FL=1